MASLRILVALILALQLVTSTAAVEIVLRDSADPPAGVVRLGDIAEIRGAGGIVARRLAETPLMPTPSPGRQEVLTARQVQDWLVAVGQDPAELRFTGAGSVAIGTAAPRAGRLDTPYAPRTEISRDGVVTRRTSVPRRQILTAAVQRQIDEQLKAALEQHLREASGDPSPWEVEFSTPSRFFSRLAERTGELQVVGGEPPWIGKHRFLVSFNGSHGQVQFPLYAHVTQPKQVIVARRAIMRGSLITAADVELQYVPAASVRSSTRVPMRQIEDITGMEATRPVRQGDVVYEDQVRAPLLVKRGDRVASVARGGGIEVRTYAVARQDGAHGDLITVESLDNKRRYDARVTGTREVAVFIGNTVVSSPRSEQPRP